MTFQVRIENSQHLFTVEPGESILDAALHRGIGLPYGCRNGACGSCVATLLSGRVQYPDGEPDALANQHHADQIIVLDKGRVVGQGTHQELMKDCETYQEIASSQLSEEELA